jgi:hypothetical protein
MSRFKHLPWLALVCCCSFACAGDDGYGSDGGSEAGPRSGVWNYVGSAPVDDTCGLTDLYVDPPGQFTLTNNGDGSFTIDDSENVFDCELEGDDFVCPERATGTNDVGAAANLDAVAHYTVRVNGSLSSASQMSGRQTVTITCEGADCATVEGIVGVTTPCGWAQDFTATAQ